MLLTETRLQIVVTRKISNVHGSNWVAPWKPARCDYFVAIFQVAKNRLKFAMSTLFVLKNARFFFRECRKTWTKHHEIQPPPSLSVSKQRRISILDGQNTVRVSFTLLEGGRGWGCEKGGGGGGGRGLSRTWLKPCFTACGKKTPGHFFYRKGVGKPNFSRFWATWKIAMKSSYRAGLHGALQLCSSLSVQPICCSQSQDKTSLITKIWTLYSHSWLSKTNL